ncbi:MAG: colicin transporter [Sphingobium sp.]|nr:colicin transporter [Sphingobium sp.]
MIAIKRLWSIMWILVIAAGALTAYLVSLRVATERNAVKALERQIYSTRANIRYLEVEFSARANIRQLAEWNARDIKYSVPGTGQYLTSERQLASLDSIEPSGQPNAAPPVMAAMARNEPAAAMIVPVKAEAPAKPAKAQDFALVRTASAAEPVRPKAMAVVAIAKPEAVPRIVKLVDKPAPKDRRAMRLAQLEATLLDPKTLGGPDAGKASR